MANIAQGKAECYISIKAEYQVLYFMYSTWQGYKEFLLATIKHAKFADFDDTLHQIDKTSFVLASYRLIQH